MRKGSSFRIRKNFKKIFIIFWRIVIRKISLYIIVDVSFVAWYICQGDNICYVVYSKISSNGHTDHWSLWDGKVIHSNEKV